MSRDACAPETCTPEAFVASQCDCSKYYYCLDGGKPTDTPLTCPPEAPYFNPDPNVLSCGNDPSYCATQAPSSCPMTCPTVPLGGAVTVDPTDCTKYYICDYNAPPAPIGPIPCPSETPWFNGVECGSDQAACCAGSSALCEPNCRDPEDIGKQIIDPLDCTKYYICLAIGTPSELYHNSCPSGQNVDITTGLCSTDASCITLCNSTNSGGVTTGPGDCQDTMTCTVEGSFPKCTSCQTQYFYCLSDQDEAYVMECPGDLVFNTDPSYPYCVLPSDCPHIA